MEGLYTRVGSKNRGGGLSPPLRSIHFNHCCRSCEAKNRKLYPISELWGPVLTSRFIGDTLNGLREHTRGVLFHTKFHRGGS